MRLHVILATIVLVVVAGYVLAAPPQTSFVPPTDANDTHTNRSYSYVNVSVYGTGTASAFIDWNRSLVLYLNMNNNTMDNSTYGNDGVIQKSLGGYPNCSLGVAGYFGGGCSFNGTGWINATFSNSLNFSGKNLTVMAWVKLINNKTSDVFGISTTIANQWSQSNIWGMFLENNTLKPSFWINNRTTSTIVMGTTGITQNQWYHLAGVFNGTHVLIYVNGSLSNSVACTNCGTYPWGGYSDLLIGGFSGWSWVLNGTIDEAMLWRRALSADEIKASYNASRYALYRNFTGLGEGEYRYYAYAINKTGDSNRTATRTLIIDTTKPILNIDSPKNISYSSAVEFKVSLNEDGDWCGFSLDDGPYVAMIKLSNRQWRYTSSLAAGSYKINFTCNDTAGNPSSYLLQNSELNASDDLTPSDALLNDDSSGLLKFPLKIQAGSVIQAAYLALNKTSHTAGFTGAAFSLYYCSNASGQSNVTGQNWTELTPIHDLSARFLSGCPYAWNRTWVSTNNGIYTWNALLAAKLDEINKFENTTLKINFTPVDTGMFMAKFDDPLLTLGDSHGFGVDEMADFLSSEGVGINQPHLNLTYEVGAVYFSVERDSIPPVISIVSPGNRTYYTSVVDYNVSINENTSWCGFSLNDGPNVTMMRYNQTYWYYRNVTMKPGSYKIIFWCNDTAGNMNNHTLGTDAVDTINASDDVDVYHSPALFGDDNHGGLFKFGIKPLLNSQILYASLNLNKTTNGDDWSQAGSWVYAYNCSASASPGAAYTGQNWTEGAAASELNALFLSRCTYTRNRTLVTQKNGTYSWNVTNAVTADVRAGLENTTLRVNYSALSTIDRSTDNIIIRVGDIGNSNDDYVIFASSEVAFGRPYLYVNHTLGHETGMEFFSVGYDTSPAYCTVTDDEVLVVGLCHTYPQQSNGADFRIDFNQRGDAMYNNVRCFQPGIVTDPGFVQEIKSYGSQFCQQATCPNYVTTYPEAQWDYRYANFNAQTIPVPLDFSFSSIPNVGTMAKIRSGGFEETGRYSIDVNGFTIHFLEYGGGSATADDKMMWYANLTVRENSCEGAGMGVTIFKMSGLTNAFSETRDQTDYRYRVCCRNVKNTCEGNYDIPVKLSAVTDALVEKNNYNNYRINTCISPTTQYAISCEYGATCPEKYACLATMSADTGARTGDCDAYPTKICCGPSQTAIIIDSLTDYPDPVNIDDPITFDALIYNQDGGTLTARICDTPDCAVKYCYMSPVNSIWRCQYVPRKEGMYIYYLNVTDISGHSKIASGSFLALNRSGLLQMLVVKPRERRIDVNTDSMDAFDVMLVNPTNNDTFIIEMTGNAQGLPLSWINFVCKSSRCVVDHDSDDKVVLTGMANSSETVTVYLSSAGKSGTFPIKFFAMTQPDNTKVAEQTAYLIVFSESFPEIFGFAVVFLVLGAIAIYWRGMGRTRRNKHY